MHNILTSGNRFHHRSHKPSSDETIDACFLVSDVRTRLGKDGRSYRMLTLHGARQAIRAFAHPDCIPVQIGQTVQVSGYLKLVGQERALMIRTMRLVEQCGKRETSQLDTDLAKFSALIGQIRPPYHTLVEQIVNDERLFDRFCRAPASTGYHHTYEGGLLHHTVTVMELGITLRPKLSVEVDANLLLTAGFLHDVGKIDAYTVHTPYELTPLGKAWGHEMLGLRILLPLLSHTDVLPPDASSRLLATLRLMPPSSLASTPPEQEVLITLDGLSVQLSRVGRLMAA